MTSRRAIRLSRGAPHCTAECEAHGCDFYRDEMGTSRADTARQAAKRHVEATGHTVYVQRSISTYIRPAGPTDKEKP